MMKKILRATSAALAIGILGFALTGCGGAKLSPKIQQSFDKKEEMYTQRNMFISSLGRYGQRMLETTNYGNGEVIPVNTKVKFKDVNSKQMSFTYNGKLVILRNIPKYSNTTVEGMINRYFGPKKVNLSNFTSSERSAIKNASSKRIEVGMSKDAVLVSRGFPPSHVTPDIKSNTWKFWETRYNTILVEFKNNKVSKIVD
ncbi:hypothetical protein FJR48_10785 [Sulfurimonas lithotrophica]|uniref:Lipoprotein n=1 Tax=Sulfurimonas lithotrophica TaxID=2590022 RepID=A0A5P8P370_9BACT|nr:hypothetical protein [Sulfurimonas lithotrophica]QFR50188.1 hypothetical protein FJR48_10785 [Sulfurimonas lithotrophica]